MNTYSDTYAVNGARIATPSAALLSGQSRLWQGVPDMTTANIRAFDPAYQGHTFLFVTGTPVFLEAAYDTTGTGAQHMTNLTTLIQEASTGFSGQNNKVVNFVEQTDGYSNRKMSHPTSVTKDIDEITVKLHEFKGLVLKNAIEYWVDGIYDEKSQVAHYYGAISTLEFSIANHTMSMLTVQVDPSWLEIQDSAWYHNMIPVEVGFEHFGWEKGQVNIVEDFDLRFKANEERGPLITEAAIAYMNSEILANMAKYFDRRNYNPYIPLPDGTFTS